MRGFGVFGIIFSVGIFMLLAAGGYYLFQESQAGHIPNPTEVLEQARATERGLDAINIANAIFEYSIDNRGAYPVAIPSDPTCIGTDIECVNLSVLVEQGYLRHLPTDPFDANSTHTAFMLYKQNERIIVEVIGEDGNVIQELR